MLIYEPKPYPDIPFKEGDIAVDYYTKTPIGQINHGERLYITVDTELFYSHWRSNGFRYRHGSFSIRFYSTMPAIMIKNKLVLKWKIHNAERITIK